MTACTSANGRGGMLSCVVLNLWMYASATGSDLQCQRDAALAGPPVCGAGQLTDVGARGQQLRCLDPQPLQAVDRREHPLGTALVHPSPERLQLRCRRIAERASSGAGGFEVAADAVRDPEDVDAAAVPHERPDQRGRRQRQRLHHAEPEHSSEQQRYQKGGAPPAHGALAALIVVVGAQPPVPPPTAPLVPAAAGAQQPLHHMLERREYSEYPPGPERPVSHRC